MKRYVTLFTAVALLLFSFFMPSENLRPVVYAGAGTGRNTEVTTPEEALDVLEYFLYRFGEDQKRESPTLSSGVVRLSAAMEGESAEEEGSVVLEPTFAYKSLTLVEESSIERHNTYRRATSYDYATMEYQYEDYAGDYLTFTRSLTVYMNEDATYYVSRGVMRYTYNHFQDNDLNRTQSLIFDAHVYVDKDKVLVRFNDITGEINGEKPPVDIAGQWLQLPKEAAADIVSMLDSQNRQYADMIIGYIEEGIESEFEKNKNVYTMYETILEENDTEIRLDLSDPENPQIIARANSNSNSANTINLYITQSFLNVDNTVIRLNAKNVRVFETMEEFEKFMEGESK